MLSRPAGWIASGTVAIAAAAAITVSVFGTAATTATTNQQTADRTVTLAAAANGVRWDGHGHAGAGAAVTRRIDPSGAMWTDHRGAIVIGLRGQRRQLALGSAVDETSRPGWCGRGDRLVPTSC